MFQLSCTSRGAAVLGFLLAVLPGCGVEVTHTTTNEERDGTEALAHDILQVGLHSWVSGESQLVFLMSHPQVDHFSDEDWENGKALAGYKILSPLQSEVGGGYAFNVRLTFRNKAGTKHGQERAYVVFKNTPGPGSGARGWYVGPKPH